MIKFSFDKETAIQTINSEITTLKRVVKPEDELKVGEVIKVKVLEVNAEQKKISLSKRQAEAPVEEAPAEEAPAAE
mgnify:CR=1 FL=1